jgi:hypothetical protein
VTLAQGGTGATSAGEAISSLGIGMRMIESHSLSNIVGTMNIGVTPNTFTVTATGTFAADGYAPVLGDIIAFNGNAGAQGGFWKVTTVGAVGVQAVFERPSWFSGTVKNTMANARFGATQGGWVYSYFGPLGNADISVGTTNITRTIVNNRSNNANTSANIFFGKQTFVGGSASSAPFQFQAGALLTTPAAHNVEWDGTSMYLTNSSSQRQTNVVAVTVPATSSSAGVVGQIAVDPVGGWLYICLATNTWKRVLLTTF